MPYVTCPACGLATYCVREDDCPRCGTRLMAPGALRRRSSVRVQGTSADVSVLRALDLAVRELSVNVALVSEVAEGTETVLWSVGEDTLPAYRPDASLPLDETICERLLSGRIANLVPDIAEDPELCGLDSVRATGARTYVGVPLTAADARIYVLCCLAGEARHDLTDADVRFLRGLAESLRPALDGVVRT
jgi:GAF domain-containing protein